MREGDLNSSLQQSPTMQVDKYDAPSAPNPKVSRNFTPPSCDGAKFASVNMAGMLINDKDESHIAPPGSSPEQSRRQTSLIRGLDRKLSSVPLAIEPESSNDSQEYFNDSHRHSQQERQHQKQKVVLETINYPATIDHTLDTNVTSGTMSTASVITTSSNDSTSSLPLQYDESIEYQLRGRERRDSESSLYPELSSVESIPNASTPSDLLAMDESFSSFGPIEPEVEIVSTSMKLPPTTTVTTKLPSKYEISELQTKVPTSGNISNSTRRRRRPQNFLSPTLRDAKANLRPCPSRSTLSSSESTDQTEDYVDGNALRDARAHLRPCASRPRSSDSASTEPQKDRIDVDSTTPSTPGVVAVKSSNSVTKGYRRSRSGSATRTTLSQLEERVSREEKKIKAECAKTPPRPQATKATIVEPDASGVSPRKRTRALLRKTLRQLEANFSSNSELPHNGSGQGLKDGNLSFSSMNGSSQQVDVNSSFSSIPGAVAVESEEDVGTPRGRSRYGLRKTLRQLEDSHSSIIQSPGAYAISAATGVEQRSSTASRQSLTDYDAATSPLSVPRSVLENAKIADGRHRHNNSNSEQGRISLPPRLPFDPAQQKISALELAPGVEDESHIEREMKGAQRHSFPASFAPYNETSVDEAVSPSRLKKTPPKIAKAGPIQTSGLQLAPGIETPDADQSLSMSKTFRLKSTFDDVDLEDPGCGRASMPGAVETSPRACGSLYSRRSSPRQSVLKLRTSQGAEPDSNEGSEAPQLPSSLRDEIDCRTEDLRDASTPPSTEDTLEPHQRLLAQAANLSTDSTLDYEGASESFRSGSSAINRNNNNAAAVRVSRAFHADEEDKGAVFAHISLGVLACIIISVVILVVVLVTTSREGPTPVPRTNDQDTNRFDMVRDVLSASISASEDLDNINSAQYAALTWVVDEDELSPISMDADEAELSELKTRYSLSVFYHSLGGPRWLRKENWLDAKTEVCDWEFITCNDSREAISIGPVSNNNLRGHMPSELQHLSELRSLSLPRNFISGFGPLGEYLEELNLSGNNLKGGIPNALFESTALESLNLDSNDLTGTLPASIGSLTSLKEFSMYQTGLKGQLSTELWPLKDLKRLDLALTYVEANFTELIQGMTNLEYLNLDLVTGITGSIPPEISSFSNLEYFFVAGTGLDGGLPAEIGDLTNLIGFAAGRTYISGFIPSWVGRLSNLERLGFEGSLISGNIPTEIGNASNLVSLNLDNTIVNSTLPSEIGKLSLLEDLRLLSTMLTGTLPSELANLRNLVSLTIAGTLLEGEVPLELCLLPNLLFICVATEYIFSLVDCNCAAICQCPSI